MYTNHKIQSANQSSTRIINRMNIIELLLHTGEMSRSQLSKTLGLSKPAIAENVDWLIKEKIVLESREGESAQKGGRRPIYLKFNNRFCYIIAIDLSPLHPICTIGDLSGNILKEKKVIIKNQSKSKELLSLFIEAISSLLLHINVNKSEIGIIAISSPGIITENFIITNPQFKNLAEIDLKKVLGKIYRVPVILKNDMNLAAVGEHVLGHGKNIDSMIYVGIGKGLGAGVILNNSLYEGRNFSAGELDFFISQELIHKNRTLEEDIAVEGLLLNLEKKVIEETKNKNHKPLSILSNIYTSKKSLSIDDVLFAYDKGDEIIKDHLKDVGKQLGIALNNVSIFLDLDLIVIGGEYLVFYDELESEIKKIITEYSPHTPPIIKKSALKEKSQIYGAFIVARNDYLQLLKL